MMSVVSIPSCLELSVFKSALVDQAIRSRTPAAPASHSPRCPATCKTAARLASGNASLLKIRNYETTGQ